MCLRPSEIPVRFTRIAGGSAAAKPTKIETANMRASVSFSTSKTGKKTAIVTEISSHVMAGGKLYRWGGGFRDQRYSLTKSFLQIFQYVQTCLDVI